MRHVLLQMCAQKNKTKTTPPRCRLALRSLKEGRTCLTSFLGSGVSPQLSYVVLIPSQQWASFQPLFPSAPRDPTSLISYTAPYRSCSRRGLRAGGSCGEEMDGLERTAVSSNCKILVILDWALWLMGLIWRLNSFGPPLNMGGREGGITDHSQEGLRHGRWRPDVVQPVRKCNRL